MVLACFPEPLEKQGLEIRDDFPAAADEQSVSEQGAELDVTFQGQLR